MPKLKDSELKKILKGETKPSQKKLTDGEGLYIIIRQLKSGIGMYWRYDYTFANKRKTYNIGAYPLITITEARKQHREIKVKLSKAIDPSIEKSALKKSQSHADNFKTIAQSWLKIKEGGEKHKIMIQRYFDNDIFPILGKHAIDEIKPPDVVKVIERIGSRGSLDQARRCGRWIYNIFRYAMTIGKTDKNPADIDFSLIIPPHIPQPHAAIIEPELCGQLLQDIDYYSGRYITRCLLKLAALLMSRPGNLVAMEWTEIDWQANTWTIEARKIKNRQHIKKANREEDAHTVPLSTQATQILKEIQAIKDPSRYVFPNQRKKNTHMTPDAIRVALRTMSYNKDVMTGHGFRAMARTMLEEQLGWDEKLAEMQLNHKIKTHGGAYDRTKHLSKRANMMQAWADYLDTLKNN